MEKKDTTRNKRTPNELEKDEEKRKEEIKQKLLYNEPYLTEELTLAVVKGLKDNSPEQNAWLEKIYNRYQERFNLDNERIWTLANIFIPLSLIGLSSLKEAPFGLAVLLGLASIALIRFWILAAEIHRAFQQKSEKILNAIESHLGFEISKKGLPKFDPHKMVEKLTVQKLRHSIYLFVTIIWIIAMVLSLLNACINTTEPVFWNWGTFWYYVGEVLTGSSK